MIGPKVLVGILYTDEQEFKQCLASIQMQVNVSIDYFVISGQKNLEAHDQLYKKFNESAGAFGWFLKMDADMVFRTPTALDTMLSYFHGNPELDRLTVDVFDWPSQMLIPGQQMYSNRVRWTGNRGGPASVVDYHGIYPGKNIRVPTKPAPLADHMPNPSPFQAFAYGVHKAIKAIQPKGPRKEFDRALLHWTILNRIYVAYKYQSDIRRLYALVGANVVFRSQTPELFADYKSEKLRELFSEQVLQSSREVLEREAEAWENQVYINIRWLNRFESA